MAKEVISLLFEGDAPTLLAGYREGVRRYRESGAAAPEQIIVAESSEGLMVTLVWGESVDHEGLGRFMRGVIEELGLPLPRPTHGTLSTNSWTQLTEGSARAAEDAARR